MQFRFQLRYQLIRILRCSHREADGFCREGRIQVDGVVETQSRKTIGSHEELRFNEVIIRQGITLKYVLFYKPNLYECTTNRQIANNIYELLPANYQDLFTLGRLDKNSEGLLLLTNDGQTYRELMHHETEVEKEYMVHTHRPINMDLKRSFTEPFLLGQRFTLPAHFQQIDENSFNVILKEGLNRHIRRICAKNNNQVKQLIRIRFGPHLLGDLQPGENREVDGF